MTTEEGLPVTAPMPDNAAPPEAMAQLDVSGGVLISTAPEAPDAVPEDLLVGHSFGEAALLLPSAATARRLLLETIRARHRAAGRPKRRRLLVCADDAGLPAEFTGDVDVEAVPEDAGAIRAAIGPQTAGLFIAPVRVSKRLRMPSGALLAELREMADEYGLALIFDETEAGLGRTGMAFAHEWTGVTPDLMLVGEGAGLPVAALVLTAKYARALPQARLPVVEADRAFARDLLAAAFKEGFEGRIQTLGWLLEDHLARLRYRRPDLFSDHVGMGLMQGLICTGPAEKLAELLAEAGLKVRTAGDLLAVLPPLDVAAEEIAAVMDLLEQTLVQMAPDDVPA